VHGQQAFQRFSRRCLGFVVSVEQIQDYAFAWEAVREPSRGRRYRACFTARVVSGFSRTLGVRLKADTSCE